MYNQTFYEKYVIGEALAEDINDYVELWHESDVDCEIYEFLGFTKDEYFLWVDNESNLNYILEAKYKNTTVKDLIEEYEKGDMIAARNVEDLDAFKSWLKKTGRI